MKSLFVVSLPRSLSTVVYHVARLALGLKEPVWTSDGEVLNYDRFTLRDGPAHDVGAKYVRQEKEPLLFQQLLTFAGDTLKREDVAYKDVVQPFLLSTFLTDKEFAVLKIKRDLTDVCYSMLQMEWFYPARAAEKSTCLDDAVVEGLIRAEKVIDSMPGETIHYEEFIDNERAIRNSLVALYPNDKVKGFTFIDDDFRKSTAKILKRRETDLYREIAQRVERIRVEIN
jgi:hypothetical protein